jgi:hypothetical protein
MRGRRVARVDDGEGSPESKIAACSFRADSQRKNLFRRLWTNILRKARRGVGRTAEYRSNAATSSSSHSLRIMTYGRRAIRTETCPSLRRINRWYNPICAFSALILDVAPA